MDSKLGTYLYVNPNLESYVPNPKTIMESEQELVTRFRTGSHSLSIETGWYFNIPCENRLCSRGLDVQTVWHMATENPDILCPSPRHCCLRELNAPLIHPIPSLLAHHTIGPCISYNLK